MGGWVWNKQTPGLELCVVRSPKAGSVDYLVLGSQGSDEGQTIFPSQEPQAQLLLGLLAHLTKTEGQRPPGTYALMHTQAHIRAHTGTHRHTRVHKHADTGVFAILGQATSPGGV